MNRILKAISFSALLVLNSCAYQYRIKDVDKALDRNEKQLGKMQKQIGADLKNKSKILDCFSEADGASNSSQEITDKINDLQAKQQEVSKATAQLEGGMKLVRAKMKGKKTINSQESDYPEFKKSLDDLEGLSKNLQKALDGYSKSSSSFQAEAKRRKILILDFNTLAADLAKATSSTEASIVAAKKEIASAKKIIGKSEIKDKEKRMVALEKMNGLLGEATVEATAAKSAATNLNKEFPQKGLVCLAPHHSAYSYINDLNGHSQRISKIGQALNKLSKEVSAKGK